MAIQTKRMPWVMSAVSCAILTLASACGGSNGTSNAQTNTQTNSAVTLAGLSISPGGAQLAKGTSARLFATGAYSDLSVKDVSAQVAWSTSDSNIVVMNGSVVNGLAKGSATVTAALSGKTASVSVVVTDAVLVSLTVTPPYQSLPKGLSEQLHATGTFTDATTQDVTSLATWSSSNATVVTVKGGMVTGANIGSATVTAALSGQNASASITSTSALVAGISIIPAGANLPVGLTQQYAASCNYTDGQRDCTSIVTWATPLNGPATITAGGLATGKLVGDTTVTASLDFGLCTANFACATTVKLSVTPAMLVSITVKPNPYTLPSGLMYPFTAIGQYSDNSSPKDISSVVTWASSDATVAAWTPSSAPIAPFGLAPGLFTTYKNGDVTITASAPGQGGTMSGTATLHVVDAVLYKIVVSPPDATIPKGLAQQYTATGYYSQSPNPITADITNQVTWTATSAIGTISNATQDKGLLSTAAVGSGAITATDPATLIAGSTTVTVTPALVMAIAITPASKSTPKGTWASFTANCTWTDNTVADCTTGLPQITWLSSDPNVASLAGPGKFYGVKQGQATITMVLPQVCDYCTRTISGASAQAQLTITDPTLVSLSIQLALPKCDGMAPENSAGLMMDGVHSQPRFLPLQFVAWGQYTDFRDTKTLVDLTNEVNWGTDPINSSIIAWLNNPGVAMGLMKGKVQITADLDNVPTAKFALTVMDFVVESIALMPDPGRVPKGLDLQFQALGRFCPVLNAASNLVDASLGGCVQRCMTPWLTWTEKDWPTYSNVATVDSGGKAHGSNVGWATIVAADPQTAVAGAADLQVTPAIVQSLTLIPVKIEVPQGATEQFSATANYSDGTTQDVTNLALWASTPKYVTFDNGPKAVRGLATAVLQSDPNYIDVTATYAQVTGTAQIDVLQRQLLSITVDPALVSIPVGTEVTFFATGNYSGDYHAQLGPGVAVWDSSDESVALISNAPSDFGLTTGLAKGDTTITAMAYDQDSQAWISGGAALTVGDPWIYMVGITPQCPSVTVGQTLQMAAWGYSTDNPGEKVNLTNEVDWITDDPTIATVTSPGGLVTGVAAEPQGSIVPIRITEPGHGAFSATLLFVGCACGQPVYDNTGACYACANVIASSH